MVATAHVHMYCTIMQHRTIYCSFDQNFNLSDMAYYPFFSISLMLLSVSQCSWLSPFSSLHVQLQHHNGQLQVVIKDTILHVACWYCTTQLQAVTYIHTHTHMFTNTMSRAAPLLSDVHRSGVTMA